jgi:hypothetical protein
MHHVRVLARWWAWLRGPAEDAPETEASAASGSSARAPQLEVVYRADGWSSRLLGVVRAEGDALNGPVELSEDRRELLRRAGVVCTQRLDLRGVWSLRLTEDRRGRWWARQIVGTWSPAVAVLHRSAGATWYTGGAAKGRQVTVQTGDTQPRD